MFDSSRRDFLRLAAAAAGVGSLDSAAAQHVHTLAANDSKAGVYQPKVFQAAEWAALAALCERIVPGASKGGAREFIDLLCSGNPDLAASWTGGLLWIAARLGKPFDQASASEQTALLDRIAYRKNETPELSPGVRFFDLARRMTVDAYYTSPAGIAEVGYKGNAGMSEFRVPDEVLKYIRA
jgi:hypothetical protein